MSAELSSATGRVSSGGSQSGSGSGSASQYSAVGKGKRVGGLQGLRDTNDGLMNMSIE
jgi:hypothetical protein